MLLQYKWLSCFFLSVFLLACEPQSEAKPQTRIVKAAFFPGLEIRKIDQITVSQQGAEPLVTLVLEEGRWQLLSPFKLPANPVLMNLLMDSLENARVLEKKTAEIGWYKHLGVDDITISQARGTLLVLDTAKDSLALIVGDKSRNQPGQYWRASSKPAQAAMRVDQVLDLPREAIGWMDREVIDLPANGVASVRIDSSDGSHFFLQRSSHQQDLVLASAATDESQLSHSVKQLVFGLTRLNFDAVEGIADETVQGATHTLTFGLFDNSAIKLSLFPDESGSWASITAINDPQGLNTALVRKMNKHLSTHRYHLSSQRTALYLQAIKSLAGEHNE